MSGRKTDPEFAGKTFRASPRFRLLAVAASGMMRAPTLGHLESDRENAKMARRTLKRSEWHRDKSGRLTCSLGERGLRVRLFEKRRDGWFYRVVWIPGKGRDQKPLRTKDKDEAFRLGKLLLSELLKNGLQPISGTPLTLGVLWRKYSLECVEFLDNGERTRQDANARWEVLRAFFGDDFRVEQLTSDDQRRYEQARRKGGISLLSGVKTVATRARSAEADIVVLHAMLRWASTKRLPGGAYLLDRNPLQNVKRVREKNKKQPFATWERYQATVAAMRRLAADTKNEAVQTRWLRMEMALFIAEATGRRLGSIRQLRWEDFKYDRGLVCWRAEADKKGYSWQVPMPQLFLDTMRDYQRRLGAIAGPLFAAPESRDGIMDRHLFDKWLSHAEKVAKQPKLDGSLWHAYRRKWATERKQSNPKDVAAAGGWKDVSTLLEVYQQSDETSVLAVMSEPKKLRERGIA
jgi:integrase